MRSRLFALVDCNSFYASCEKVFAPEWEGRPVVILSNNDGCVVALTKEAKGLGIKRGVPYFKIKNLLENNGGKAFSSNYALYGDISGRVMTLLAGLAPEIEIYSIDECFLDLTGIEEYPESYGFRIKRDVWQWTRIPVSVGIGPTKTLAKAANRRAKARGEGVTCLDSPEAARGLLEETPVEEVWGIGPRYAAKLRRRGVETAYSLSTLPDRWIRENLGGIAGLRVARELRGESCLELEDIAPKKEIVCSRSFGTPVTKKREMEEAVATYAARAAEKLRSQKSLASLVTVFFYTDRFRKEEPQYGNTATSSLMEPTDATGTLIRTALALTGRIFRGGYSYKKCGVLLSGVIPAGERPLSLFPLPEAGKERDVSSLLDHINEKWGRDTLVYAAQGVSSQKWPMKRQMLSPRYTTVWDEILTVRI
ncbi:Y-family DNA polymerase [Candidatus Mcinerneyibacteriota bacterium]|nr:Y-family DNA polymerase [Candidatus Mcinerneyibacteriota bacterium]